MALIIIKKRTIASVQVIYYLPDYENILNEFIWQTEDISPEFPRIDKFIKYWDKNIEGPIDSIDFCSSHAINYNLMFVDCDFTIH